MHIGISFSGNKFGKINVSISFYRKLFTLTQSVYKSFTIFLFFVDLAFDGSSTDYPWAITDLEDSVAPSNS